MQAPYTETNATVTTWRDYIELTKPGMVLILLLSSIAAMFIAAEGVPNLRTFAVTVVGLHLALSGASVLNSYLDCDLDCLVKSTKQRPLPMQKIHPKQALTFGLALVTVSFLILLSMGYALAAFLALAGVLLYVVVYTRWLKRRSVYSTFVAGIAAAIPILVGWSSITGSLAIETLVLFAIIFYWVTPHFWSFALLHRNEFVRAGLPMLPVLQGPNAARIQIGRYTVLMVFMTLLPVGMGLLDRYYAVVALVLGGFMVFNAAQLYQAPSIQTNLRFYKNSLLYIALLLAAMLADRAIL